MRAGQEIRLHLKGQGVVPLRPSLRASFNLSDRPGGFPKLIADLQDGSLTAACDIIRAASPDIPDLEAKALATGLDALSIRLLFFVLACLGLDQEQPDNAEPATGKQVTLTEHLASLYRYGTGWMGWTPDQTLAATPAEIVEAVKGRTDMLRAIFGTSEAEGKPKEPVDLKAKFRAAFGIIGTTKAPSTTTGAA